MVKYYSIWPELVDSWQMWRIQLQEGAEKDAMAPRSILMEDTPEPPAAAPAPVAPAVASTGEVEKEKEDVTSKVESTEPWRFSDF